MLRKASGRGWINTPDFWPLDIFRRLEYPLPMKLEEVQKRAMDLPDSDRASLAADLLVSLPGVLVDADDGIDEARRRSGELDENPSAGCSWLEIKQALEREEIPPEHLRLLNARFARVDSGEAMLHDWDVVK